MVVNISDYKSHPHKELTDHTQGVMDNVKQLTSSKLAALAALFHDLGKLNPNFQDKLFNKPVYGYSSHAFLSSFGLLCFYTKNQAWLKKKLGEEDFPYYFSELSTNWNIVKKYSIFVASNTVLFEATNILQK